jgi:hypothetical protein
MAKSTKVRIIPVTSESEVAWLVKLVTTELAAVIPTLDAVGRSYDHEVPWATRYLADAKGYLKRVQIGAIGRINTCEAAIQLGVINKIPAKSHHFTSMGLYYVFRIARQKRRAVVYVKELEKWLSTYAETKGRSPHLFTNYSRSSCYGEGS